MELTVDVTARRFADVTARQLNCQGENCGHHRDRIVTARQLLTDVTTRPCKIVVDVTTRPLSTDVTARQIIVDVTLRQQLTDVALVCPSRLTGRKEPIFYLSDVIARKVDQPVSSKIKKIWPAAVGQSSKGRRECTLLVWLSLTSAPAVLLTERVTVRDGTSHADLCKVC